MVEDNVIAKEDKNGNNKEIFQLNAKVLDINADVDVVILNNMFAKFYGITNSSKVLIKSNGNEIAALVDTSSTLIKENEIGIFKNFAEEYNISDNSLITVMLLPFAESIDLIKKKLNKEELTEQEFKIIVDDLINNKIGLIEVSAFITALYTNGMTDEEILGMTNAILSTGKALDLKTDLVVDKHCIGGVAGNRTTMIIVPIIASLGIYFPKTSSRSITSASGTADTFETIANVSYSLGEMEEIVKKTHGCIVWGGSLNLAAADDRLIKIRHPLKLDPEELLLASILAKKKSVNAKHLVIDIPIGTGAKIADIHQAKKLGNKFEVLGKRLGINTKAIITDGSSPVGYGVGPALECLDVLRVLDNSKHANKFLREKGCYLAGKLLEMIGYCERNKGYEIAYKTIETGKALKKFREIVAAQGGKEDINENDLPKAKYSAPLLAKNKGKILYINNRTISQIARIAGAPNDKAAGVYLYVTSGDVIKQNHCILDIFSNSETKLTAALKYAENNPPLVIKDFIV
ncbi:MAG: AMP phosphorylase [Candidatus Micrarchaeota archaeon]|nr:AMP phosphorylase [Candidatus Micrarchaeota archaeon]